MVMVSCTLLMPSLGHLGSFARYPHVQLSRVEKGDVTDQGPSAVLGQLGSSSFKEMRSFMLLKIVKYLRRLLTLLEEFTPARLG